MRRFLDFLRDTIPAPIRWAIGIGLAITLAFFLWYQGTRIWNGIGNWLFHRQINAERLKVQKELDQAAEQKKALEETLRELAVVKKDYEDAKAEKDRLEAIFNDSAKSAAEKVAEFKKSLASGPVVTPTDGITNESLCAKAKAANSNPDLIAALCGR